jgi:F1F0 ATPase subunit 2
MNETVFIILALFTGVALGTLFFGGLWFTVRKAMDSKIPALWFFTSFIVRTAIAVYGFYLIMLGANAVAGITCLVGFIAARFMVSRYTKNYELKHKKAEEATYEA